VYQWNVGANMQWTAFEFGASYGETDTELNGADVDADVWTVGLGWANGPYTAGATYYETDGDDATNTDAERWTVGGTYNYGPGMTFRGAVAFGETEAAGTDEDFTQVTLGTEVNF
jgi:predicted porin